MKRLKREFFNRPTVKVAQELLGKFLVRKIGKRIIKTAILETEAYCGAKDLACHASKGLTRRTKVMFGPPGFSYVYMIYGMYHCLNIVTQKEGSPSAVLIRAIDCDGCDGPGKLCRQLKVDRKLNAVDMTKSNLLWVEDNENKINPRHIKKGKRIGVDYSGKWKDKLWRFYID